MTTNMSHPPAERLEAFVEGILDGGDRVVVESHLLGCPECRSAVEEWTALFTALAGLPQFEPAPGFTERVMAGVQLAGRAQARAARSRARYWQSAQAAISAAADRAGASLGRLIPQTTFGWAMAAAFLSLPVVFAAAAMGWLVSRSYITPQSLWLFASNQAVAGVRSAGETAVATALQTDIAAWLVGQSATLLETAGFTGVGVLIAAAGATTVLSIWVLYRNLFRTPTRESNYVSYSF
jgi:anti-sigma factor RsiW